MKLRFADHDWAAVSRPEFLDPVGWICQRCGDKMPRARAVTAPDRLSTDQRASLEQQGYEIHESPYLPDPDQIYVIDGRACAPPCPNLIFTRDQP